MKRRKFRQKRHEVAEEDVNRAGAKVRRAKKFQQERREQGREPGFSNSIKSE